MKVTVNTFLNVRTGTPEILRHNNTGDKYYNPGEVLDISEPIIGENYKDNSIWYKLVNGGFVWSGGVINPNPIWGYNSDKMSWAFKMPDGIDVLSLWNKGFDGRNVKIAILDSGINTAIKDIYSAVKDKELDVKSFIPGTKIDDDWGHGTACISVAVARGWKTFGSAPMANLIVGKIRNARQTFTPSIILTALKWACEERNADIISMSFSWNSIKPDICNYIQEQSLPPNNRIFVGAVTNAGDIAKDTLLTPANCNDCISVGSYTENRVACNSSGWNPNLFFISPGDKLKSYEILGDDISTLDCQTSYACPFTAGVLACLVSYYKNNNKDFNAQSFFQLLCSPECVDINISNYNITQHGKGVLNPIKILNKILLT